MDRHESVSDREEQQRVRLPKKLIVCCDGTWQDSDNGWVPGKWGQPGHLQNPTNVTRLARAVSSEDKSHHPQIVYYQAGIGTGLGLYNHLVGGGTGLGLEDNVREAYAFLASNYSENDKLVPNDLIFLLGFSRGAFTARTLGGFICCMGILRKKAMALFYQVFEDWERAGDPHYKPAFFDAYFDQHHDVKKVKPDDKLARSKDHNDRDEWFDTRLDSDVKNAFHALALDERRFPFSPAVWERKPGCTSNLHQVWFPGSHSNIGGSYADAGMADITLAWMMDHLAGHTMEHPEDFHHRDWIQFDEEYIDYWYDISSSWYEEHKEEPYKGWARGKVYDSNTFPQSILGSRTRGPGRYHGTFYESGKTDPNRLLEHTNEQIHSSVRARIDMGARGVEPDWAQVFPHGWEFKPLIIWLWRKMTGHRPRVYQPQNKGGPLHGWKLLDGHASHADPNWELNMSPVESRPAGLKQVEWVFEGDGKSVKGLAPPKAMPEARLGRYERMLLEKDQRMAKKVEFTNNRWHWFRKDAPRPTHGRTF